MCIGEGCADFMADTSEMLTQRTGERVWQTLNHRVSSVRFLSFV